MFKKSLGLPLIAIMFCAVCSEANGYFNLKKGKKEVTYGDLNLLKQPTALVDKPAMFEFVPNDEKEGKSVAPTRMMGTKGHLFCIVDGEKRGPLFFGLGWPHIKEKRAFTGSSVWVMRTSGDLERTLHNFLTPLWVLDVKDKGVDVVTQEAKKVVYKVEEGVKKGVEATKKFFTPKGKVETAVEKAEKGLKEFGKEVKEKYNDLTGK